MDEFFNGAETLSLFCRTFLNLKRNLPIRNSEMGLLIYLVRSSEANEDVTSIQIGQFLKISKPMVTAMTTSLIKGDYIVRIQDENDKRSYKLIPTGKAKTLVHSTYQEYLKAFVILKEEMGEENYKRFIELADQANAIFIKGNSKDE
ncbi:MAG: MarR family transcriptional regulator [Bacillales bacterium]|jgi:DNA-binding MarR family transcriptional regulator|nr:MarR family transcriptional regulator [Bacillales bacterium]